MVGALGLGSQARPCLRLVAMVFLFAFLSFFYFFSDVTSVSYLDFIRPSGIETDFYYSSGPTTYLADTSDNLTTPREGYLVWSPGCRIPDIDPWHESIRKLIHKVEPIDCSTLPPLSLMDGYTLRLLTNNFHHYKTSLKCCYEIITRHDSSKFNTKVDDVFSRSKCLQLEDSVNLTSEQEFIMVKCIGQRRNSEVYKNFHAVVPIRKNIRKKMRNNITPEQQRMSVLIVGIDSISRLNLIRTMPRTVGLLNETGWVEMKGYNKMDDNTFPNLMAILTGLNYTTVRHECMLDNKKAVDNCPFIWKNFSQQGYVTAYGEDEPVIGTFNYLKTGFFKMPTDYYLRPFMLAAEKNMKVKKKDGLKICLGPTLSTDYIYKYATDLSTTFRDHLYFALFWMNSLSHNNINTPSALDKRTFKFFQDLMNNGVLNNSIVIFLSDHGMRFGKIRETYVGWIEERLPFLYIWMPEWYRKLYPERYTNLLDNTMKLTSPFDLHLTLQQILYSEHTNGSVSCPSCMSMFDEVPWNRSCLDVGVTEHWCTCSEYRTLSTEGTAVQSMVSFVLGEMNSLLDQGRGYVTHQSKCAKLTVKRVLAVRSKIYARRLGYNEYVVLFEALPSQGLFEATVSHSEQFKLLGTVSRINFFGSQSQCMKDAFLQKYCFCVKL